jgi:hypothetical protein
MEKPSIAGETPALHWQSSILCKLVPSYFESGGCHIYTKQNLEWITGWPRKTGRIYESKKMNQNANLIHDNSFLLFV